MDFLVTHSGTITAVVNGKVYNVPKDNVNYEKCKQALKDNNPQEFEKFASIVESVKKFTRNKVEIRDGIVYYGGQALHNTLTERILSLMNEGFPFNPMIKFLENLMLNPSHRSVEQLYRFLEHKSLPITEDGKFLAYKKVRNDYKDWHTGTISYKPGETVSMNRNQVDDDPDSHCSKGIHAGSILYCSEFHQNEGKIVIVKICPSQTVAVPRDCNCQKLRCCSLEVVGEFTGELTQALYNQHGQESCSKYEEWEDDFEDDDEWDDDEDDFDDEYSWN